MCRTPHVMQYSFHVMTVGRPQPRRIVAAPLDVPFNPAARRTGSPVPRLNHFVAGRGRPDALLLHVLRSFRVVSCHNGSVLFLSVALPEVQAIPADDASIAQYEDIVLRAVATPAEKAVFNARSRFWWFHFCDLPWSPHPACVGCSHRHYPVAERGAKVHVALDAYFQNTKNSATTSRLLKWMSM